MSGTLLDLKAACKRELFNRTNLDTEIAAAIQAACTHYQKHEFYFSEGWETGSTVANQPNMGLPADLGWIDGITIVYSNYPVPMIRRDWQTMQDLYVNQQSLKGQPTDYALFGQQLWFWPTPNAAYALTMYKNLQNAPPAADTDSNNWTVDAEELIRSRAVADVQCHIMKRQDALTEFANVMAEGFMSGRERIAYKQLKELSALQMSSGRIKPIDF